MRTVLSYFGGSIVLSVIGLVLAAFLGFWEFNTVAGCFEALSIVIALSLLELSISFENAVVNAAVLGKMSPVWQHRFLTWGIWIAVFGMRLIFPLAIVCISAWIDPLTALRVSIWEPQRYAEIMLAVEHEVNAFGGAFLAMAALKYFFNVEKDVHWIHIVEAPLAKLGKLESIEIAIVLGCLWGLTRNLPEHAAHSVLAAGVFGVATYIVVESFASYLKEASPGRRRGGNADLGLFLYLEVLDASFSFDGVIGAFAISNHLFYITIGLGIGALFVRSLTVLMVDRGTLEAFKFLENGAFWAVGSLAIMMFTGIHYKVPEALASSIGIVLIGLSIWSSLRARKT